MRTRALFFFLLVPLFLPALKAQRVLEPYFVHIPPERFGASQCGTPFFDGKGGMWFISDKGLKYYNGYTVKTYAHIPGDTNSLLENQLNTFFRDKHGKFWLGYSTVGGVTRFDPEKNKFEHFHPDSTRANAIPDALVVRFKEDAKGRLWLLMWDGGLVELDHKTGLCKRIYQRDFNNPADTLGILGNRVKGMFPMGNDEFLLGFFSGGAYAPHPMIFNAAKGTFKKFSTEEFIKNANENERYKIYEAFTIVHDIYRDRNGNFWFATYSSLIFVDMKNKRAQRVTGAANVSKGRNLENARGFMEDEMGRLWIATSTTGLMIVDINTREVISVKQSDERESGLADNRIGSFAKDKDGNIWFSGGMGGFSIYVPFFQQFQLHFWSRMNLEYSNRSAQDAPCNYMLLIGNDTLAVSSENGISYYSLSQRKLVSQFKPEFEYNKKAKPSLLVNYFFKRGKQLFLNYKDRAVVTSAKGGSEINYPGNARVRGMFVIAGDDGRLPVLMHWYQRKEIRIYDQEKNRLFPFDSIAGVRSTNITWMADTAWLIRTSDRSFMIYNPIKHAGFYYSCDSTGKHYFPDSTITRCYPAPNKTIWVATANGVYELNYVTGKYKLLNEELKLEEGDIVQAIIFDKRGMAWFTVGKKLMRYSLTDKTLFHANEFVDFSLGSFIEKIPFADNEGKLYFATTRGQLVIDPEQLVPPNRKPELFLSGGWVSENKLNTNELRELIGNKHVFSASQNYLLFEFHTDQFYTPRAHRFFYRFKGEKTWTENGTSNRIRFTNISHGSYTLEIKTINGFNIESEILTISFAVARPYWATWWFYTLLAVAGISIFYLLIKLRERALKRKQEELEAVIHERTAEVVTKAREIELQKNVIEEKNKELTDSIHYAQRIQQSILPDSGAMQAHLQHFVYFKPKDIVSGDFYWFSKQKDSILWAVVDCTGHGVPGGFMSMLGSGLLNQIVNEEQKLQPDEVLNQLRKRVIIALKQTGADGESRDGMDISFCRYIPSKKQLEFAGANNPVYVVKNNVLSEIKADKQPIGIFVDDVKPFTLHTITINKGDSVYMTSDGYADQFGGEKGKKFKSSSFEKLLSQILSKGMPEQLEIIENTFSAWKGDYEQLDDVCVMGVKI